MIMAWQIWIWRLSIIQIWQKSRHIWRSQCRSVRGKY